MQTRANHSFLLISVNSSIPDDLSPSTRISLFVHLKSDLNFCYPDIVVPLKEILDDIFDNVDGMVAARWAMRRMEEREEGKQVRERGHVHLFHHSLTFATGEKEKCLGIEK